MKIEDAATHYDVHYFPSGSIVAEQHPNSCVHLAFDSMHH